MAADWLIEQARAAAAAELAESIVRGLDIVKPPIDPFYIIGTEGKRISVFGDDFGDAFDGRIEYQAPQYLLFYNSKYNAWTHAGVNHPKINFTIAHELGHYFLERHRNYLMKGGLPHGSITEFVSDNLSEREADAFASGLLMPKHIAKPIVNAAPPTLDSVKSARSTFDVSLTSMMVRWIQLSDFPCAICCVRDGKIEWGFTSEPFKEAGAYRVRRGKPVTSPAALKFLNADRALSKYREGEGWSGIGHWVDFGQDGLYVTEFFAAIPSTRQLLVLLMAEEDDVFENSDDEPFSNSDYD